MKTANNPENKARFFVQYWGVKALNIGGVGLAVVGNGGWNLKHPDFFLELTPLSDITDEDAIEVYCSNLIGFPKHQANLIKKDFSNGILSVQISHKNYNHLVEIFLDANYFDLRRADYLRSKGYALPYMDLSIDDLIDYGWIKIKTDGRL